MCVWLVTPEHDAIQTVAASFHPLDLELSLETLAKSAKFAADWDKVLVIGGRAAGGVPLGQAEADAMIAEVLERLAGGGFRTSKMQFLNATASASMKSNFQRI